MPTVAGGQLERQQVVGALRIRELGDPDEKIHGGPKNEKQETLILRRSVDALAEKTSRESGAAVMRLVGDAIDAVRSAARAEYQRGKPGP